MSKNKLENTNAPPNALGGWRLLGVMAAGLALLALAVLVLDPGVDGVRRLIRVTARTSLVLFCLSFIAGAAAKRFPAAWTRWLRLNRRYFGLGFALSHGVHAIAIASFAALDPIGFRKATGGNYVSGTIAYVFILLMSATSFDRSAAWIGPRAWRVLHTAGAHFIWISFMITFGKRIPGSAGYVVPLVMLTCVMALRLWPAKREQPAIAALR